MVKIESVAIVGSGVMGAGIAAHFANANINVKLLDIVKEGEGDPNFLVKSAIEKLKKSDPAAITHKSKLKNIQIGNLRDNLDYLKNVDWVIEVIIERKDFKQDLYKKIQPIIKKDCIVSSNTSTLPLHELIDGMDNNFKKNFYITHFFNPPRYMKLLELVTHKANDSNVTNSLEKFIDINLGKGVVHCHDTPGFIANRIGCYWLVYALQQAVKSGISIEEADDVMSRPLGIPKTGVFGLMDLIGLDLMPLIAKSMLSSLDKKDAFCVMYNEPEVYKEMLEKGYYGRKSGGGFYKLRKDEDGKNVKQAIDLKTGEYHDAKKVNLESSKLAKDGLIKLVSHSDIGGQYAKEVLVNLLHYTIDIAESIADSIYDIDQAMKLGYNWKYGPFELVDRLSHEEVCGTSWLINAMNEKGMNIPKILLQAKDKKFYKQDNKKQYYLSFKGDYLEIPINKEALNVAYFKNNNLQVVLRNPSASLHDIGDGVACLEFHSKMNSLDPLSLEMVSKSVDKVKQEFKALVIANDSENFSAGANLGFVLYAINCAAWKMIHDIIKQGQDSYMQLKYAPFPVIGAPTGMALGGGCEILLHCDGVQAHVELYSGLVEVGVGIIPGWGGTKEMILRHINQVVEKNNKVSLLGGMFKFIPFLKFINYMPALSEAFQTIGTAKVSKSAEEAKDLLLMGDRMRISMNRNRILLDAKKYALEMAKNYVTPQSPVITLPGKTARVAFDMAVKSFAKTGKATPHDVVIMKHLGYVLSGGDKGMNKPITEQEILDIEREMFMELIKTVPTRDRIEHMLNTGKPLRN